jgi:two-component system, chemotaxis family, chemotaxis protein CheY
MIDWFYNIKEICLSGTYRLRRPKTLTHALKQILSPSLVSTISSEIESFDLIENVSVKSNIQEVILLKKVADRIGILSTNRLQVPSKQLVDNTNLSIESLKSICAIAQPSNASSQSYALAISDPFYVDINAFRSIGIPIILSTGKAIKNAWEMYDWAQCQYDEVILENQMLAGLKQLAVDASMKGAKEVFIGYPEDGKYEFISFLEAEKRYSGVIHPAIYNWLLSKCAQGKQIIENVNLEHIKSINFAITKSINKPVICLTWKSISEESITKPITNSSTKRISEAKPASWDNLHQVLLIDDDERFLFILGEIMQNKGWSVHKELNGEGALNSLKNGSIKPSLIVSDIHMPRIDGVTLLRTIRELGITTPVLMLTSDDDQLLEAELALLGANAFVRKHEDPRILLAWCNNLCNFSPSKIIGNCKNNGSSKTHLEHLHE